MPETLLADIDPITCTDIYSRVAVNAAILGIYPESLDVATFHSPSSTTIELSTRRVPSAPRI